MNIPLYSLYYGVFFEKISLFSAFSQWGSAVFSNNFFLKNFIVFFFYMFTALVIIYSFQVHAIHIVLEAYLYQSLSVLPVSENGQLL